MAHQITVHDGRALAIYGRNMPAWHELGGLEPGLMLPERVTEVIRPPLIQKRQVHFYLKDGMVSQEPAEIQAADKFQITVAQYDNGMEVPLGQVKDGYAVCQWKHLIDTCQPMVDAFGATYDAAGVLEDGKVFWLLLLLPTQLMVGKTDKHEEFLLAYTRNDGGGCVTFKIVRIRVVCANTAAVALDGKSKFEVKIRHSGQMEVKLQEVERAITIAAAGLKNSGQDFESMLAKELDKKHQWSLVLESLGMTDRLIHKDGSPKEGKEISGRTRNALLALQHCFRLEGVSMPEQEGTVYQAFNTVTRFVDHHAKRGGGDPHKKLASMGFGTGTKEKENAYSLCLAASRDENSGLIIPDFLPSDIG